MLLPHIGELPAFTSGVRNSSVRCCASATRDAARAHPRQQARRAVLALVPVVHAREHLFALVDGEHRTLGDDRELLVGDDVAISMIVSESGFRPVISRSIQTR